MAAPYARSIATLVLGSSAVLTGMAKWEKQVLEVYPDRFAKGLPTFCSGSTDWNMPIGKKFSKLECDAQDRRIAIEYGAAILRCVDNTYLDQVSLDALTLFAINKGKVGACGSRAVALFNAGRINDGCRALRFGPDGQDVWVYVGKTYIPGLANRQLYTMNWCLGHIDPLRT